MVLNLLKSKLYKACITKTDINQEGSCAIDADLIELAGLREFEQVEIYNLENGKRFKTYVIPAAAGSGTCCINGEPAVNVETGDRVIIVAYAQFTEAEAAIFQPLVVHLTEENKVERVEKSVRSKAA